MEITDIRIRAVTGHSSLRGIATITLDDSIVIHNIRIIDGRKGPFIAFPRAKLPAGEYKDIVHPINIETRQAMQDMLLDAYRELIASTRNSQ